MLMGNWWQPRPILHVFAEQLPIKSAYSSQGPRKKNKPRESMSSSFGPPPTHAPGRLMRQSRRIPPIAAIRRIPIHHFPSYSIVIPSCMAGHFSNMHSPNKMSLASTQVSWHDMYSRTEVLGRSVEGFSHADRDSHTNVPRDMSRWI
jgi:hypothetical protein